MMIASLLGQVRFGDGMASYLVKEEHCERPIETGVKMMGALSIASDGAFLRYEPLGDGDSVGVTLESSSFSRYVEYVVEAPEGSTWRTCDGVFGCRGRRCSVRRFRDGGGSGAAATLSLSPVTATGSVRYAWATTYGAVSVGAGDEGDLQSASCLPPPDLVGLTWELNVGCDFSGFFVELLGVVGALVDFFGDRFAVAGVSCDADALSALLPREALAVSAATGRRRAPGALRVVHGLCDLDSGPIDVARLMVEREYAVGRDEAVYACARAAGAIWTPTAWAAKQFELAGIPAAKLSVVPEAVDVEAWSPSAVDAAAAAVVEEALPRAADVVTNRGGNRGLHCHFNL